MKDEKLTKAQMDALLTLYNGVQLASTEHGLMLGDEKIDGRIVAALERKGLIQYRKGVTFCRCCGQPIIMGKEYHITEMGKAVVEENHELGE